MHKHANLLLDTYLQSCCPHIFSLQMKSDERTQLIHLNFFFEHLRFILNLLFYPSKSCFCLQRCLSLAPFIATFNLLKFKNFRKETSWNAGHHEGWISSLSLPDFMGRTLALFIKTLADQLLFAFWFTPGEVNVTPQHLKPAVQHHTLGCATNIGQPLFQAILQGQIAA